MYIYIYIYIPNFELQCILCACLYRQKEEVSVRYSDTLLTESERGLSIKATPITLCMRDIREKTYLMNVFDTPGHVNFSDEVCESL